MKNSRTLIIGLILLLVIALVGYLFAYRGSVRLTLAPETADIVVDQAIDRQTVHDGDRLYLTPGKHTLTFYRNDFSIERLDITVASLHSKEQLVALTPLTDSAKKIMQATKNQERLTTYTAHKKNALFDLLPIHSGDYTIEGCPSLKPSLDTKHRALCLGEVVSGGTDKAKRYLLSIGYDPRIYEVYTGDATAVKIVYTTDTYTVSYPTNEDLDKPVLTILFKNPTARPAVTQKDTVLADLSRHGYNPDDYYLYFLDPALTHFSTLTGETELLN